MSFTKMTLCLLQNRHSVIYLTERKVRIMGKHCQKPIKPSEKSELRFVSSQSAHALSAFKERIRLSFAPLFLLLRR